MFTVRKDDGTDILIGIDELRGERREDGWFVVHLKDGAKGILMRESELAQERKTFESELDKLFTQKEDEEPDKPFDIEKFKNDWWKRDS